MRPIRVGSGTRFASVPAQDLRPVVPWRTDLGRVPRGSTPRMHIPVVWGCDHDGFVTNPFLRERSRAGGTLLREICGRLFRGEPILDESLVDRLPECTSLSSGA